MTQGLIDKINEMKKDGFIFWRTENNDVIEFGVKRRFVSKHGGKTEIGDKQVFNISDDEESEIEKVIERISVRWSYELKTLR